MTSYKNIFKIVKQVTMHKQIVIAIMVTKKIPSYSPVSIHAVIVEMTRETNF